jgi:DNA-binding beta-propeller fold protein YncE
VAGALVLLTSLPPALDAQTFLFNLAIGGRNGGQVDTPLGVAIDRDGNIYVTETGNHRISKFNRDGAFVTMWGFGVQTSANVFQTCEEFFCRQGIAGTGNGQFNFPGKLSFDNAGNLVVPDTGGTGASGPDRVQILSPSGMFIRQFGSHGVPAGQLFLVLATAVDRAGNIYTADSQHGLQKFDANGTFLQAIGSRGSGAGQYRSVGDVKIDGAGNVYVTDTGNSRVLKFDPNATFLFAWGYGVRDGTAAPQVCSESCRAGIRGPGDGQFAQPSSLAIDASNHVFVSDLTNTVSETNHRVQVFDANGNFLLKIGSRGSRDGQFQFPAGLAADNAGRIYVADQFNNRVPVFRVDHDGDRRLGLLDADGDGDGIRDGLERRGGVAAVAAAAAPEDEDSDLDGDGIDNEFDLDSDGDGIPDLVEAGGVDADGDGRVDDARDEDGDGLADAVDDDQGGEELSPPDTNDDGTPDFLDGDADGDGVSDAAEAGGRDDNDNGILDDNEDLDRDGLADSVQASAGGAPLPLLDTDADGTPDYQDDATANAGGGNDDDGCAVQPAHGSPMGIILYLIVPAVLWIRRFGQAANFDTTLPAPLMK